MWHLDRYDKLTPYGFPIHACIDGYTIGVVVFVGLDDIDVYLYIQIFKEDTMVART